MPVQQVLPFGNAAIEPRRRAEVTPPAAGRLHLHYSNRTEKLLEALIRNLEAAGARPDSSPLDPATIIVPNRQIETYLKFGIARARGIASNLKTPFLRHFLGEVIEACRPDVRIVAEHRLRGLLLTLLSDPAALADPDLAPARGYLLAAGGDPDAFALRVWQLSGQIAHLFEEYDYSRPEMLDAWSAGRGEPGVPAADGDAEVWQRAIWRALWGPGALVERRSREAGEKWLTAPKAFRQLTPAQLAAVLPRDIHVFGISYAARAFHEIFAVLASAANLHIYAMTPSVEFREDLASPSSASRPLPSRDSVRRPSAWRGEEDPFGLAAEGETPAVRLWGRPARENIWMLASRSGCELLPCFDAPPKSSPALLGQLQRDILAREPERESPEPGNRFEGDRSLSVFQCPGVRRELETIAGEIWSILESDQSAETGRPPLRFNDIVVILPAADLAVYQAHTASVFGETHGIPYSLVDLSLAAGSRVADAASLLLKLPHGRFTRQDVLRVAAHPCVIGRFPDADPDEWLAWCDSLAIFHGADHDDHCETYIERDLCNWDQGLRRLALGAFLAGRTSGEPRVYESGGESYLPEEVPAGSLDSAAGFVTLIRSLIEDARFCRRRRMPIAGWGAYLQALFRAYFAPRTDQDERDLLRCLAAVQALEELGLGEESVPYRIPYEFLEGELSSLSGGRGQYLADGVVVSSFLPMRAIPFRVIFIAGLGEGKFPAPESRNALDLRQRKRYPGDVSARERDKSMFLETLLCARERVILSYVCRDALTGDEIPPSSVIRELRHLLEREYLGKNGFENLVTRFRLRRYEESPASLEKLAPAARIEKNAQLLGDSLRRAHAGRPVPCLSDLPRSLSEKTWTGLARTLEMPPKVAAPAEPPEERPAEKIVLSIGTLRKFLECPLQGSARAYLKLREDDSEEDLLTQEAEPLESGILPRIMLLRGAFLEAVERLRGDDSADARDAFRGACERRAAVLALEGRLPTGIFGEAERKEYLAVLEKWWRAYPYRSSKLTVYRFGRADEHEAVDEILDPIVLEEVALDSRKARIEIYGKTDPVIEEDPGALLLQRHKADDIRKQKDSLRAFFDQLLMTASGIRARKPYSACLLLADADGEACHRETFDAMTPEEARSYLATLCREMLRGGNDTLLPCEAVFKWKSDESKSLSEIIEKFREGKEKGSFAWGPVPYPETYPAPDSDAARAMIERRFGLYFRKRRVGRSR